MTTVDEARAALRSRLHPDRRFMVDALIAAVRAESAETLAAADALADAIARWRSGVIVEDLAVKYRIKRATLAATPAEDGRDPYDSDPEWQRQAADLDR